MKRVAVFILTFCCVMQAWGQAEPKEKFIENSNSTEAGSLDADVMALLKGRFSKTIPLLFDYALEENDTGLLNILLHKDLKWVHSNGWEQNKKEVLNDIKQKVTYKNVQQAYASIEEQDEDVTIKRKLRVAGIYQTTDFDLFLFIEEEWTKEHETWQLKKRIVIQ